jgi:2-polyprenyl-3-methyl-5-hydroxy-6-metoxy-1,4-benzoquinol methylase
MRKQTACPLCKSKKVYLYIKGATSWEYEGKFDFLKCIKCQLIFLYPKPKASLSSKYYPPATYWGKDIRKERPCFDKKTWQKEVREKYGHLYQEIFRLFLYPGRALDIGCGAGGFLKVLLDSGWQVVGSEFSKSAASYSRETFGLEVKQGDFLTADFSSQKFNLIILNNVLEHLENPDAVIKKISRLLESQGIVVVVTPNSQSLGEKIFGRDWYGLHPGRHLYLFSLPNLMLLLRRNHLKIISCRQISGNHNFYSLFESFRFKFSPKFRKRKSGGLLTPIDQPRQGPIYFILKKPAVFLLKAASLGLIYLGAMMRRGEMLTIYAQKA